MATQASRGRAVLLRACRPCTSKPDPILYLPMTTTARSRLVRWRLGRFANLREECPCLSGAFISRDHFLSCRALDSELFSALPSPPAGVHLIDHALNSLPVKASTGPPPFWSALLQLLHAIDSLVHPLATIAPEPDPHGSWLPPSSSS